MQAELRVVEIIGDADRGRLKVWVELRQTATGSLLRVQCNIRVGTVWSKAYLIFDPGALRKNLISPKGI